MKLMEYRPIKFFKIYIAMIILLTIVLGYHIYMLINIIDKKNSYPYHEFDINSLYYVSEGDLVEGYIGSEDIVLYIYEKGANTDYVHLFVKTPQKKIVYLFGETDSIGDYYSIEMASKGEGLGECFCSGRVQIMEGKQAIEVQKRLTSDALSKFGLTADDLSWAYITMDVHDSQPTDDDISNMAVRCIVVAIVLLVLLLPILRNAIYLSRVKKGKAKPVSFIYKEDDNDEPAPRALYHTKSDDFWLMEPSALDKDDEDGYNNGNNDNS